MDKIKKLKRKMSAAEDLIRDAIEMHDMMQGVLTTEEAGECCADAQVILAAAQDLVAACCPPGP